MFTEIGHVVAVEGDRAWVQTLTKTGCSSCQVNTTCGSGIVNKAFSHKVFVTPLKNTLNAHINDEVEVGIPEDLVLKGSLAVYLLPLIFLMLALGLSSILFPQLSELGSILSATAGLVTGFLFVRWLLNREKNKTRLEPKLIRIVKRPIEVTQIVTSDD
ncbi:SoxR reducing system RseC family protein [Kangiella sediminilitoris]|uniref:Positive regulator of sigma E, RseC/MucC n=1 Tax=Kangiella sediminilitoris TaxID=1144748 RepID=A0A1B3BC94_9GAMM|nr:SoxR reducing system RseC family protein [Kangiella sediminilitoris]AOE50402.1 Positive regulator of sigma E, RseC/MucC [Kangiella sediminilitoris]